MANEPIIHREKQLQFQLWSIEHARRNYPLRGKTVQDCVTEAEAVFGRATPNTPFSIHFSPDRSYQYIICEGVVANLPKSETGIYDSYMTPDNRPFISDGTNSFFPADLAKAAREACHYR